MRAKFDEQLHMLNQEMMHMGSMIEDKIQKAIEALIGQNSALAKEIMEADNEVDREQKKIENICFNLLMQQQPVARDLRVISAAMKMVTDMERIGDHAADISEMTVMMASEPYVVDLSDIKKMAKSTCKPCSTTWLSCKTEDEPAGEGKDGELKNIKKTTGRSSILLPPVF